ncbi:MAG: TonB-dependent receptor, partial [Saprospiraceae bacterium]|nr:TonB-dependent receptor [Saprospiraceae bacterium]
MKKIYLFFFLSLISAVAFAQSNKKAIIKGIIVDAQTATPLSYATIQIFKSANNALITGGITDDNGQFVIETSPGDFYALVDFIGYDQLKSENFTLSADKPYNLGILKLNSAATSLNEVLVQAEKSTMELKLDKRVFNVGKDLGNAGGSATEILNNIPSVTVDAEGNVRLRGNGNVRILIDGKPSGLVSFKGGSGLQQLQASLVEKVEVITNPSARYEAEGMTGIINIVLKKDRKQGFNGSFEITSGAPTNIGGAANVNYRHNKINFFINYGIAYRILPSINSLYQEVYTNDTTFISTQSYDGRHKGFSTNIRGGLDYFFDEKNILTASYLYRRSKGNRFTDLRYDDYVFNKSNLLNYTTRTQDEDETEPNSEYAISYKKLFAKKGQELNADIRFLDNWELSDQVYTQFTYFPNGTLDESKNTLQTSVNDETEKQLLMQLDYVYPFGKEGKLEAGFRSSFRDMTNDYLVQEQDDSGVFVTLPGLDNDFLYDENIHAAYGIVGNKIKRFSYQFGVRAEWTDVKTTLVETREENPRKYSNLFPSVHFTYDLLHENAVQISYSRRVRRPVYNELSPYVTFSDNRNFFSGNPDLDPEFSNVFELGHIKYF